MSTSNLDILKSKLKTHEGAPRNKLYADSGNSVNFKPVFPTPKNGGLREPYPKKLHYSFDCDENLNIYVKLKLKRGNCPDFFTTLFIENQLLTENVKKGVRGNEPNGRTVQPTQLTLISIEAKLCALKNYRVFFFLRISL